MKKKFVLYFVLLVIFGCGCLYLSINDSRNILNNEIDNESFDISTIETSKILPIENDVVNNNIFVQIRADYPEYKSAKDIVTAASNIYIGTVKSITFDIIDMETGKIDVSPKSQSTSRMLYTVYTISINNSLKGETQNEMKIYRLGGIVGYNESEQYNKLKDSRLLDKYNGIPIIIGEICTLSIGNDYLFCTNDFNFAINAKQFAHKIGSNMSDEIIQVLQKISEETGDGSKLLEK